MSIIDLQRRLMEAGRIRIGEKVATKTGSRPSKLSTFRLTSRDKARIDAAAKLYGGEVTPWLSPDGNQFQVITQRDWLPVIVPPVDMTFSTHYELWSAGGCQRRCDGAFESIGDRECVCDPDARECKIHTRLSVMLSELPGLGVWRVETQGWNAAHELSAAVAVIEGIAGRASLIPARLRLEQRSTKRLNAGKSETFRFAVPVLDLDITPQQLLGGGADIRALAAAEPERPALPAGRPALTPVPPADTATVQQQMRSLEEGVPERTTKRRKGTAAPIPPTGVRPRTQAQATAGSGVAPEVHGNVHHEASPHGADKESPTSDASNLLLPSDEDSPPGATPEPEPPATPAQIKKLAALAGNLGWTDEIRRRMAGVVSFKQLTKAHAHWLIDEWETAERENRVPRAAPWSEQADLWDADPQGEPEPQAPAPPPALAMVEAALSNRFPGQVTRTRWLIAQFEEFGVGALDQCSEAQLQVLLERLRQVAAR